MTTAIKHIVCIGILLLSACEPSTTPPKATSEPLAPTPQAEAQPIVLDGFDAKESEQILAMATIPPLPVDETNEVVQNPDAMKLGHQLFFDTRLSANTHIACASCHRPDHGFSMSAPLGMGHSATPRHPPSLINIAYHHWFDWDGKSDSLWSQAARPLENPVEHRISRVGIAHLFATHDDLRTAYEKVFPTHALPSKEEANTWPLDAMPDGDATPEQQAKWDNLSDAQRDTINRIFVNALKAIAAYESQLIQFDSRFDQWVAWQQTPKTERTGPSPMTQEEVNGLKHFLNEGKCITCHNGPLLTDMDFHNLGLGQRAWLEGLPMDEGRKGGVAHLKASELNSLGQHSANAKGKRAQWTKYLISTPENQGQFKTPSLRNVDLSPPYMHAGHFDDLESVVRFYVKLDEETQTGHREDSLHPANLSPTQQLELVAFLKALTGKPRKEEWFAPPAQLQ